MDMDRIDLDARRPVVRGKGFAEGVDRAGADIAEHHADRADCHLGKAVLAMAMSMVGLGRRMIARCSCIFSRIAHNCAPSIAGLSSAPPGFRRQGGGA